MSLKINQDQFKSILHKVINPIREDVLMCLIHGLEKKSKSHDIDIYIVVDDGKNIGNIISKIAPFLYKAIKTTKILISCFPIYKSVFDKNESQFIKNIKKNSIEFEIK